MSMRHHASAYISMRAALPLAGSSARPLPPAGPRVHHTAHQCTQQVLKTAVAQQRRWSVFFSPCLRVGHRACATHRDAAKRQRPTRDARDRARAAPKQRAYTTSSGQYLHFRTSKASTLSTAALPGISIGTFALVKQVNLVPVLRQETVLFQLARDVEQHAGRRLVCDLAGALASVVVLLYQYSK
jgi:hypothetical protein